MFRRSRSAFSRALLAAAVGAAAVQAARAQDSAVQPLNTFVTVPVPRLGRNIAPDARWVRAGDIAHRRTFLDALVVWLAKNFDLPANFQHPMIKFVPAQAVTAVRYAAFLNDPARAAAAQGDVVAVYKTDTRTIYLRDDWEGITPADVSVLVHEMVHHLQTLGQLTFTCPQEREKVAFQAQQRWLNAFDTDLEREFGLDAFTLLAGSLCY